MSYLKNKISFSVSGWWQVVLYIGIIFLAYQLISTLNTPTVIRADAQGYYNYAQSILKSDFSIPLRGVRTYGYPFFLALCIQLAQTLAIPDALGVIAFVQFVLHIATAAFSTRIFQRFVPQAHRSISLLVFALIACNPYLLAKVSQVLTESVTVFLVTLFFYVAQTEYQKAHITNRLLMGALIGIAYLVRPFHLVWGLGVLGIWALLSGLLFWRQRVGFASYRTLVLRLIPTLLILAALAGTQTLMVQFYTDNTPPAILNALPPNRTQSTIFIHVSLAHFFYRFEGFYTPEDGQIYSVQYINPSLYLNPWQVEIIAVPGLKLISMFQQHDYQVYRPTIGVTSLSAFAVGFVLWAFFCHCVLKGILQFISALRTKTAYPLEMLFVVACAIYTLLYAFPVVPEPRFIVQIYPVLTVLVLTYVMYEKQRRLWYGTILFAAITYLITFYLTMQYILVNYALVGV